MTERLIRGKAIKGDTNYESYYDFPVQRPIEDLIDALDEIFARGAKAVTWHQTHGVWDDSSYSDFEADDMRVTTDPEVAALWIEDDSYPEDLEYDDFISGSGHVEGLSAVDFPDVVTGEFDHALIEHFGRNARVVVTPEDVYRFDYDGGY